MLDQFSSATENIKCFVRCRPINSKEQELGAGCITINEDLASLTVENKAATGNSKESERMFTLDHVFSDKTSQEFMFTSIGLPILKSFVLGYNCTVFAYGQTGAGKTHTMMGPLDSIYEMQSDLHGLIPRMLYFLFNQEEEIKMIIEANSNAAQCVRNLKLDIKCSCFEIYQEHIIDLLCSGDNSSADDKLVVREDSRKGMLIDGLTEISVCNDTAAKEMIMLGLKNRHVAATAMNAESSRSHLIFTIFLNISYTIDDGIYATRSSRLHLIDLAGSESQRTSKAMGERIKEAGMINKSLSTLGNVINALVEMNEGKTRYVPFRDSKLTYFLKDSLGGNAKTMIIANISQSMIQIHDTLSTLKFVQRAKMIKNRAIINENITAHTVKIMQDEILQLREALAEYANKGIMPYETKCSKRIAVDDVASLDLHKEINTLIEKIANLFTYEESIAGKLNLLDTVTRHSIEMFFKNKEIYELNYASLIHKLEKKIKQISNMLKFKENILNEIKDQLAKYQQDQVYDNLFIEKINFCTEELMKFKSDFDTKDNLLTLHKLAQENSLMHQEILSYKFLNDFYSNNNSTVKTDDTYKTETEVLNTVRMFIETNKDIHSFFNKNIFSSTDNSGTYAIIDQKYLDKLKFQIEEYKLSDEQQVRTIEDIQSENFLLNMELMKYRSGENQNPEENKDEEDLYVSSMKREDELINPVKEFCSSTPRKKDNNNSSEFMSNLKSSVLHASPNKKLLQSQNECNKHSCFLTKEGYELVKLKEKLDDALLSLDERDREVFNQNAKIEELLCEKNILKIEKEQLEVEIYGLREHVETLTESNAILSYDVISLHEKNKALLDTMTDVNEIIWEIDDVNSISEELYLNYVNDMDKYMNLLTIYNSEKQKMKIKISELFGKNQLMMQFKDRLKQELAQMKKRNESLEKDMMNYISTATSSDEIQLRKENCELIDRIMQLDPKNIIKDTNGRFAKALNILQNVQETLELQNFYLENRLRCVNQNQCNGSITDSSHNQAYSYSSFKGESKKQAQNRDKTPQKEKKANGFQRAVIYNSKTPSKREKEKDYPKITSVSPIKSFKK